MGEIHQFVNATAERTGRTIPELDLAAMVPAHWHMNINNDTKYVPLNDFNDDLVNDMMNQMENMNDNDGYNEKWIGHNIAWGSLGIVFCVGLVLIMGGRYLYIKRKKIHYFLDAKAPEKSKRKPVKHIELRSNVEDLILLNVL